VKFGSHGYERLELTQLHPHTVRAIDRFWR